MQWQGSAVWRCPAVCGCRLRIDATWPAAPIDGISDRHPVPRTIRSIAVVAVCHAHAALLEAPLPADPWFGSQGYLTLPADRSTLDGPTRLYVHLARFRAEAARLVCGCRRYILKDAYSADAPTILEHDRVTVYCPEHAPAVDQVTR